MSGFPIAALLSEGQTSEPVVDELGELVRRCSTSAAARDSSESARGSGTRLGFWSGLVVRPDQTAADAHCQPVGGVGCRQADCSHCYAQGSWLRVPSSTSLKPA